MKSNSSRPPPSPESAPPLLETILLLEKVVQDPEQIWIENLNILEHLIVNITENYLNSNSDLIWKSNFIVRRLPTCLASCTNTNEYAIILKNFEYSLSPSTVTPSSTLISSKSSHVSGTGSSLSSPSSRTRGHGQASRLQPGQLSIFEPGPSSISSTRRNENEPLSQFIVEETREFSSEKVFKEFARSFLDGFNKELARNSSNTSSNNEAPTQAGREVQLVGPQLLANMINNPTIDKIFKLTQSRIPSLNRGKVGKCTMNIDYVKNVVVLELEETRVTVRPALYYNMSSTIDTMQSTACTRQNKSIIERLPLHHPLFLNITQALTKGQLIFPFPANCETAWVYGFWPSEAHILANFHPSSIPTRTLKLFSLFCLQPQSFLEFVSNRRSNSLLVLNRDPDDDDENGDFDDDDDGAIRLDSFTHKNSNQGGNEPDAEQPDQLTIDFLVHCFLTELESSPKIEDWAPSAFPKRLHSILTAALDSVEKCFYPNYFNRTNLLKGFGKAGRAGSSNMQDSSGNGEHRVSANIQSFIDDKGFGEEDDDVERVYGLDEDEDDDTFTLGEIDLRHYAEIQEDVSDRDQRERDIDFGITFEELKIDESEEGTQTSTSNFHVVNPFTSLQQAGSSDKAPDSAHASTGGGTSLTKKGIGSLLKRISTSLSKRSSVDETELQQQKQPADNGALEGFEESINQARREQTMGAHLPPSSSISKSTSTKTYVNQGFEPAPESSQMLRSQPLPPQKESIFKIILESLCTNELFYAIVTPPRHLPIQEDDEDAEHERAALMIHMEQARKTLYAQDELISTWQKVVSEIIRPKYICPHTFTLRQIQYIGLVMSCVIKCTCPSLANAAATTSATTTWEISGDILRTVLYQMRSEPSTMLQKGGRLHVNARNALKSKSFNVEREVTAPKPQSMLARTLSSLVPNMQHSRGSYDICKTHHHHLLDSPESSVVNDEFETTTFGMDNPELATTHRLLQWLWQLRNSKIGRLSTRAGKYIELLHESSLVNSFFLEQWSSSNIMQALAIKSAQAVTQIMASSPTSTTVPAHIPLVAAWKRGWIWAEMVLSLVAWNSEKGIELKANVPVFKQNNEGVEYVDAYREQYIQLVYEDPTQDTDSNPFDNTTTTGPSTTTCVAGLTKQLHSLELDDNAITLAFHSEPATPIGWNDFEDPRRPGPWTVPVLTLSACGYYNQWEVIGGNIIQVMTRLQKFNSLQQVGSLLAQPHKKTALNEIRKLSKSSSFKTFQFDGNVVTKTFRRLASLRNTARNRSHRRQQASHSSCSRATGRGRQQNGTGGLCYLTCDHAGCPTSDQLPSSASIVGKTIVTFHNCTEIECTKL